MATSMEEARNKTLKLLLAHPYALASTIGYTAFPDTKFRWTQGAAFGSAKLRHDLVKEGLIWWDGQKRGYILTEKGKAAARSINH